MTAHGAAYARRPVASRGDSGARGCMVIAPTGSASTKMMSTDFKAKQKWLITFPKVRPLEFIDSSCYPVPNKTLVMLKE